MWRRLAHRVAPQSVPNSKSHTGKNPRSASSRGRGHGLRPPANSPAASNVALILEVIALFSTGLFVSGLMYFR